MFLPFQANRLYKGSGSRSECQKRALSVIGGEPKGQRGNEGPARSDFLREKHRRLTVDPRRPLQTLVQDLPIRGQGLAGGGTGSLRAQASFKRSPASEGMSFFGQGSFSHLLPTSQASRMKSKAETLTALRSPVTVSSIKSRWHNSH
jgi:hypothetical protein